MTIHTSRITTQQDGDLSIDPNGTGEVKLTKLANQGETPLSVNDSGEVGKLELRDLLELEGGVQTEDLIAVQRGDYFYQLNADELGGGGSGGGSVDPTPVNVTWTPSDPPGTGTASDPYVLTPVVVSTPGGTAQSLEQMALSGLAPTASIVFNDENSNGVRFDQGAKITDISGSIAPFSFVYNDSPASSSGQIYTGLIRIGSGLYVQWDVTQVANVTTFSPAGSPNASPASVNYGLDSKYGTVTGSYADTPGALLASGSALFTINGGTATSSGTLAAGDSLGVLFDATDVDAAAQGDLISGTINGPSGFLLAPSLLVNRNADAFTPGPLTNVSTSSVATSSNIPITGINCKSFVTLGTATLGSVEASINGNAFTAIPASGTTMPINPGETLIIRGTTGGANSTAYTADISVGTTVGTWSVTTSAATPAISQPVITSPIDGATDIVPDTDLVSSAYAGVNGAGPHTSSDWEVYEADLQPLQTSVITAANDSSDASSWSPGSGVSFGQNAYNGDYADYAEFSGGSSNVVTFSPPLLWSDFYLAGGRTSEVNQSMIIGTDQGTYTLTDTGSNWPGSAGSIFDKLFTAPAGAVFTKIYTLQVNAGSNAAVVRGFQQYDPSTAGDFLFVDNAATVGLTDGTNLTEFSVGDSVQQDSGGQPTSSAIVSATAASGSGVTETLYSPSPGAGLGQVNSGMLTYANNAFFMTGGNASNIIFRSANNGASFTTTTVNGTIEYYTNRGVQYNASIGTYYTTGFIRDGGSTERPTLWTSTNGTSWTENKTTTIGNQVLACAVYDGTQWVGVIKQTSSGGNFYTSTDKLNWTVVSGVTGATRNSPRGFYYQGGLYYYHDSGTLYRSSNISTWTQIRYNVNDFQIIDGALVTLDQSTWKPAISYDNGDTWVEGDAPFGGTGYSITKANGLWFAYVHGTSTTAKIRTGSALDNWFDPIYVSTLYSRASAVGAASSGTHAMSIAFDKSVATDAAAYSIVTQYADFPPYTLVLTDDTNLKNFRVGDQVTQTGGTATGEVTAIGTNSIDVNAITGTWFSNGTNQVIGPDLPAATGTILSIDTGANRMSFRPTTGRWLVTESGYSSAEKLDKAVANPAIVNVSPGAPDTDPPDAGIYTSVVNAAGDTTNLTTYPLTDTELDPNKAYYSRVRYNDNGSTVSPYSNYAEFVTASAFTNNYVGVPGPFYVSNGTSSTQFGIVNNPVEFTAACWGDFALALGVDNKLYSKPSAQTSFTEMLPFLTPSSKVEGIGQSYSLGYFLYFDEAGSLVCGNTDSQYVQSTWTRGSGTLPIGITWSPDDTQTYWAALFDDGNIYISPQKVNLMQNAPTGPWTLRTSGSTIKQICATAGIGTGTIPNNRMLGISETGQLMRIDINLSDGTGTNSITDISGGNVYKAVHSGWSGTVGAIRTNGVLDLFNNSSTIQVTAGPAGQTIKEIAFSYYSLWALTDAGDIYAVGQTADFGATSNWAGGTLPTPTTWEKLILPRPCQNFGATSFSGSGYTYAFVLPTS